MTKKFSLAELESKMKGNEDFLPFEINIGNSVDTFLKIRESLTRIGRRQVTDDKKYIWQVCHLVQDEDTLKYYIVHFKHLYVLSGRNEKTQWTDQDLSQLMYIVNKIKSWDLGTFPEYFSEEPFDNKCNISIIPFAKKSEYILRRKFFLRGKKDKEVSSKA